MASRCSPFLAGMGAAPMPLQQALVGLLMQLQGGSVDVRLGDLTAPLRTLAQALAPLPPRTMAACLPMVMLPVYSMLTSPDAAPGKDGARLKQRAPAEADALVAALECVQTAAAKAGPRFIQEEPTAFLKLLTHLALWLGALSASDSTKRVEWWLEEKAALGALNALVRCWRWAASDESEPAAGEPAADEKGPNGHADGSDLDSFDNAIPSLDEVLGDDEPLPSDAAAASASSAEEWAILEAQWSEVTRVLLHSVGGAVVAQLVQSLLAIVGKDRDRDVRLLALAALEGMVGLLPSPAVWRPFFPGVFSGLLKVVLAGSGEAANVREGSRLGAAALRVALAVTAMLVSPEANGELAPLLVRGMGGLSLSGGGVGGGSTTTGSSSGSSAWASFQTAVLSSVQPFTTSSSSSNSSSSSSSSSSSKTTQSKKKRYREMAVPAKMAVTVDAAWARGLQEKLSDYLPLLLRACLVSGSPRVRRELAAGLAAVVGGGEAEQEEEEREGVSLLDFEGGTTAAAAGEEGAAGGDASTSSSNACGRLGGAARLRVQVLDALVGLQGDDDPGAAAFARAALRRLLARDRARPFLSSAAAVVKPLASRSRLLDRIGALLGELPGVAAAVQDRALGANLRLLRGYLELLLETSSWGEGGGKGAEEGVGPAGLSLLTTEVEATMGALAAALEPEKAGAGLAMQVIDPLTAADPTSTAPSTSEAAAPGPATAVLGYYRQGFRNFRSEEALGEMRAVLRLLGRAGGAPGAYAAADFVLARLRDGANRMMRRRGGEGGARAAWARERLPLVFILNHVVQGAAQEAGGGRSRGSADESLEAAARLFLEGLFLTEGGVWRLPTGQAEAEAAAPTAVAGLLAAGAAAGDAAAAQQQQQQQQQEEEAAIPAEALDTNARLVALLVEGVGDCCATLHTAALPGPQQERCLMLALFPLVEKLGDPHPVVRQAALTTLHRLGAADAAAAAATATAATAASSASSALAVSSSSSVSVVGDLLARNLDYLVEALCASLRKQQRRQRQRQQQHQSTAGLAPPPLAPAVLEALVAHAGPTASRALVRELSGVVLNMVDADAAGAGAADMRHSYGMMRVLLVLARAVRLEEGVGPGKEGGRGRRRRRGRGESTALRVPAAAYWREKLVAEFGATSGQEGRGQGDGAEGGQETAEAFFRGYHGRARGEEGEEEGKQQQQLEIDKLMPAGVDGGEEEDEDEEEEDDDTPTTDEALLLEMMDRCTHFLARPSLFVQHQALAVLAAALGRLHAHSRRNVLLPTVHRLWPALLARLHACSAAVGTTRRQPGQDEAALDPSWAFLLLSDALALVGVLVGVCGDFLSLKFTEELWPVLRALLAAMARGPPPPLAAARGGKRGGSGGKLVIGPPSSSSSPLSPAGPPRLLAAARPSEAPEPGSVEEDPAGATTSMAPALHHQQQQQQQRQTLRARAEAAVLACLRRFAEADACYRYTAPLVYDIAEACAFVLTRPAAGAPQGTAGATDPRTLDEAVGLFRALGRLDGAAVWPVLMRVAGWDLSTRPPSRAAVGVGGRAVGEAHARRLVAWLEEGEEEMAWCAL